MLSHALCGRRVNETSDGLVQCSFCHSSCKGELVVRSFYLRVTLADESAKVFAWCTGQTAAELLQISPDEFYELPEVRSLLFMTHSINLVYVIYDVWLSKQSLYDVWSK